MDLIIITILIITIILIGCHSYSISQKNIFEPIYYFLIGCFYVYIIEYLIYRKVLLTFFGDSHVAISLIIVWISILIFYAGYRSKFSKRLAKKLPVPQVNWRPGALIPYGIFLTILGISGYFFFIKQSGGISEYFSAPRGKGAYEENTAYLYGAQWLLNPALIILIVEISRMRLARFLKIFVYIFAVSYFGYQIFIGQRSGVASVGLLLLSSYYLPNQRFNRLKLIKLFPAVFIIIIATGFVSKFRGEIYVGSTFEGIRDFIQNPFSVQVSELFVSTPTGGGADWYGAEITMYMNYLRVIPKYVDYDYGEFYLGYLTIWIPRILWPNKPFLGEKKKIELENVIGTSHVSGPAVTMLGMYHLHFGIPGIIIGMFLSGILLGAIEYWRKYNPDNYGVTLIFLVSFTLGLSVVSNGFLAGLHFWVPFFYCLF